MHTSVAVLVVARYIAQFFWTDLLESETLETIGTDASLKNGDRRQGLDAIRKAGKKAA